MFKLALLSENGKEKIPTIDKTIEKIYETKWGLRIFLSNDVVACLVAFCYVGLIPHQSSSLNTNLWYDVEWGGQTNSPLLFTQQKRTKEKLNQHHSTRRPNAFSILKSTTLDGVEWKCWNYIARGLKQGSQTCSTCWIQLCRTMLNKIVEFVCPKP